MFPGADPRWSLAELIHAVILMAHAHSLCSFVWGCGLNPEPDHAGGYTFQSPAPSHITHIPAQEDGRQEVSPSCECGHWTPNLRMTKWVNSPFTVHTCLVSCRRYFALLILELCILEFVVKQPCGIFSSWWMVRWRWRSWWRGWWNFSSSKRKRSARKRRWLLVLRGRGARASQQVQPLTRL